MTPQPPQPGSPQSQPARPAPMPLGPGGAPGTSSSVSRSSLPFVAPPPVLKVGAASGSTTKVDMPKPQFAAPAQPAEERHDPQTLAQWHAHYLAEGYEKDALVAQAQSVFAGDEAAFHAYWYAFHEAIAAAAQPAAPVAEPAPQPTPLSGAYGVPPAGPLDYRSAGPDAPASPYGAPYAAGNYDAPPAPGQYAPPPAPSPYEYATQDYESVQGAAVYLRVRQLPMGTQTTPMGWMLSGAVALFALVAAYGMAFASDKLIGDLPTYVPAEYLGTVDQASYVAARDQLLLYGGAWSAYNAAYNQDPIAIEQLQQFDRTLPVKDPWNTGYTMTGSYIISAGPDAGLSTDDDLYTVGNSEVIGNGPVFAGVLDFASMLRAAEGNAMRVRELQMQMYEEQMGQEGDYGDGMYEEGDTSYEDTSGYNPGVQDTSGEMPSEVFEGRESEE